MVSEVREYVGLHEYDGVVADLSPEGVKSRLARLGDGPPEPDAHDEAHLAAFEERLRAEFGAAELHRRSPMALLAELDLSAYERDYAPAAERAAARRRHMAAWPDAIDAGLASLDQVSAPVARSLQAAVDGLTAGLVADGQDPDDPLVAAARGAHARFAHGPPGGRHRRPRRGPRRPPAGPAARGGGAHRPGPRAPGGAGRRRAGPAAGVAGRRLPAHRPAQADRAGRRRPARRPPGPDQVIDEARTLVDETIAFTREHRLVPDLDGVCEVAHSPPSRRWATALMSWAAPYEADAPSRYYVTPPDPSWPPGQQRAWLEVFNRATLPAITVHEVALGHFAHGRALRRAAGDVRRTLHSLAFVEGWAHYAELAVETGLGTATRASRRASRSRRSSG